MRKAIVTGGAGFIGSHLVERLLQDGYSVTVLDNFSTGRKENLSHFTPVKNLLIRDVDISDYELISPNFEGADCVFHLAALADIVPSIEKPLDYYRANVTGTVSVLEASRKAKVSRFLYAASSSCYGIARNFPTSEAEEIQPQYPYALTKYLGEEAVFHWEKVYGLPCVSLRLFNVFGSRARTSGTYGAVFGVFLAQKIAKKPFTVVGDGRQTRDFTFVTDVVDAFLAAANSSISGECFNVGSGGTQSVNHLVELLGGPVVHISKRPGEPDCTFADISKIKAQLGWTPKVSFEDGVRAMLDHIDDWRGAPVWDEASIREVTKDWFTYLGKEKIQIPTVQRI